MEQFRDVQKNSDSIKIGKYLITEGMIRQIKDLIKSRGMLKIKILKAAFNEDQEKERIIAEILSKTGTYLLDYRGNNFIISRTSVEGLNISKKCKEIMDLSKNLEDSE